MKKSSFISVSLCAVVAFGVTSSVFAQSLPQSFEISGLVRDFSASHPNFQEVGNGPKVQVAPNLGLDGKPMFVTSTQGGNGTADNFAQWFKDVPGVNQSKEIKMKFTKKADYNQYVVSTFYTNTPDNPIYRPDQSVPSFFPINNELLGNEDNLYNYHFTFEARPEFIYKPGQKITVTVDDQVFIFINNKLALSADSTNTPNATKSLVLDATNAGQFGLVAGQKYPFTIFFSENATGNSALFIDTDIQFIDRPISTWGTTGGGSGSPVNLSCIAITVPNVTIQKVQELLRLANNSSNPNDGSCSEMMLSSIRTFKLNNGFNPPSPLKVDDVLYNLLLTKTGQGGTTTTGTGTNTTTGTGTGTNTDTTVTAPEMIQLVSISAPSNRVTVGSVPLFTLKLSKPVQPGAIINVATSSNLKRVLRFEIKGNRPTDTLVSNGWRTGGGRKAKISDVGPLKVYAIGQKGVRGVDSTRLELNSYRATLPAAFTGSPVVR